MLFVPSWWILFLIPPTYAADCDLNGIDDVADIEAGGSADCNGNGVSDLCETVPLVFAEDGEPLIFSGLPQRVTSGDLDGDGRTDLLVGNWQDTLGVEARLSIFFNRSGRDFAPELALETTGLSETELADVDADGDLDIVTVAGGVLGIYANDSSGGFGGQIQEGALEVASSPGMRELAVVDVDSDGRLDLLTLNGTEGALIWYPNLGESPLGERFRGEPLTFELFGRVSARTGLFLTVADFDSDGDADAAITNSRTMTVSVFHNSEQGASFAMAHSLTAAGRIDALASSDLDGDGRADLVAAANLGHLNSLQTGRVNVWLSNEGEGRPEGGFEEASTLRLSRLESMTLSDVDADAFPDLLIGRIEGTVHTVGILRGGGDGRFQAPLTFGVPGQIFAADDFDGDGAADLALAIADQAKLLFQGERAGAILERLRFEGNGQVHFLDVADFTGDGILDVVTANSDLTHTVFFGNGDGTLAAQTVELLGPRIEGVVVADLDRDGSQDLIFRSDRSELIVQLSLGGGEFKEPVFLPAAFDGSQHLATADVDGDGRSDIIGVNWGGHVVVVHFGDGRGGVSEPLLLEVGQHPWTVAAGDLDSDGDVDFVTANGNSADISLLLQKDPRSQPRCFAPAVSVPLDGSPRGLALGDFDRDGDLDIVTANEGTEDVAIFLNRGDGVVDPPAHRFPLGRNPAHVTVSDLNQDGADDLVTANSRFRDNTPEGGISILLGRGDGTFAEPEEFRTDGEPRMAISRDMDADGDPDLVVGHRFSESVVVLLNETVAAGLSDDFLATICTPLDFELLSRVDGLSLQDRALRAESRTSFLLPVRNDATLLPTLFVNATRFPRGLDFLREVFPERFADLNDMGFADLVLRRGSRRYFTGSVRRLRLENGSTVYGFDVETDAAGPQELLSLEETRMVFEVLRKSFLVTPLVYAPTTRGACEAATGRMTDFPVVILCDGEEPLPQEPTASPTFLLEIPADTVLCGVFALAGTERGPREEYELKSQVRLRAGTLTLPTANETFTAELAEEVLFGPELVAAEAQETGTFRVVRIPPNEMQSDVTTFRFTYSQPFTVAPTLQTPARLLELEVVSPLVFRARGDVPLKESQVLPEEFSSVLKGREPLQARLDGTPLLRYGSCSYALLPLWRIEAELEDGTLLRLEERFEEAESLFDTGPASLVRAEVALPAVRSDEGRRVVTEYVDLIYSAARHNTEVDYWVILDPPVMVPDVGEVYGVELQAPEVMDPPRDAAATYLGANFKTLRSVSVTRFSRQAVPREEGEVLFRRGDGNADGELTVLDALALLEYIFARGENLPCPKAGDTNDDGRLSVVDPIALVAQLFGGRGALPQPFPDCGTDPTVDALSCRGVPACP